MLRPAHHVDSIERDTVLVFGAGASFGARCSAETPPPRGFELASYLLRWLDVNRLPAGPSRWIVEDDEDEDRPDVRLWDDYKELRPILERARDSGEPDSFERAMATLASAGRVRLLDSLNRVLTVSFLAGKACAFREGEDQYDMLFRALGPRLRAFLTPNYDLLGEEALRRVGGPFLVRGNDEHARCHRRLQNPRLRSTSLRSHARVAERRSRSRRGTQGPFGSASRSPSRAATTITPSTRSGPAIGMSSGTRTSTTGTAP